VTQFIQQIINAISLGGTYALLALGLAIVFSILGLINFAHGDLMTIAGYVIYFSLGAGLPFGVAIILGIAAAAVAALMMERIAFRPLRGASIPVLLLASIAISGGLEVVFQSVINPRPEPIVTPAFLSRAVTVGSFTFGVTQLISIAVAAVMLILMNVMLKHTTIGIAMRAAAENFPVTRLMGINANRVIAVAFGLSGILAGAAAVLWIANEGSVYPTMGLQPLIAAFIAAIIGGLGSLGGAVAGAFVLAFIQIFLQAYLPGGLLPYQDALAFGLVIAVLLWRPQGILGRQAEV
jgi:branched-chain amino acid transport system permease protein